LKQLVILMVSCGVWWLYDVLPTVTMGYETTFAPEQFCDTFPDIE